MNIKRFFAPDMRRAIHQVRSEHGPDAVVLSSHSVDGGVEIIAAVDYDQDLLARMMRGSSAAPEAVPDLVHAANAAPAGPSDSSAGSVAVSGPARQIGRRRDDDPTLSAMHVELQTLKGMLREQFTHLAWADLRGFDPQRAFLLRRVEALGLDPSLVESLVEEVEHPEQQDRAWRDVMLGIARRLQVMREDPLEQGGVFALVGPTGVGKTTTIAKLAARHCLRHGRESLALITTDNFRVGAQRQLDAFGAIMGVPVRRAETAEQLAALLTELAGRRLVLIDTAGFAPRDERLAASLRLLDAVTGLRRFLVLAANMQASIMHDAARRFGGNKLAGAVLTKLDEAHGLGAAVSVLIGARLPAAWLSEGQRVPEDLKLARIVHLIKWATAAPDGDHDAQSASTPYLGGKVRYRRAAHVAA